MSMDADMRTEYRDIESKAVDHEYDAKSKMDEGDPRRGQVHATLAVAARLEALSYALRHQGQT